MHKLAQRDRNYVWHPFTQMRDWLKREPILIQKGKGAVLQDVRGHKFLDANSSIWTNLHGHGHPKINQAIQRQLGKIAHSSALGLANEPASLLAEKLIKAANLQRGTPRLARVFYSDDGSTAMEAALKLAYEYARRSGRSRNPKFLTLEGAYHGDTVGAVSLGHIDLFHKTYAGLLFKTEKVMAPYCYRCPYNRARPERADARQYRQCHWECVTLVERKMAVQRQRGNPYAAMAIEPLIQGAAGMIAQPQGWLKQVAEIVRADGAQLIADEVMTGFGRTGLDRFDTLGQRLEPQSARELRSKAPAASLFACHLEGVQPDLLVLAKGLTGGYLPMAATLATQAIFEVFLGDYAEFKTFFHGHSYTANQLAGAAALASLELLERPASRWERRALSQCLYDEIQGLWSLPQVGDIRQAGLIVGVELVKDWRTRQPYDLREQVGIRVCTAMARRGVLTRPIGNVLVLMPPYCTTPQQVKKMVGAMHEAIVEVLPHGMMRRE